MRFCDTDQVCLEKIAKMVDRNLALAAHHSPHFMHFMLCCIRNHIYNVMSGCMLLSNQLNKVLNNIKWIMECGNELIGKHIPHTLDYVLCVTPSGGCMHMKMAASLEASLETGVSMAVSLSHPVIN